MVLQDEIKHSLKSLKGINRRLVMNYLHRSGAVSVNDISTACGLSKMTVHKIVDFYLQKGIIETAGKGESTEGGGKKPNLYSFNPNCCVFFAARLDDSELFSTLCNLKGDILVPKRTVAFEPNDISAAIDIIGDAFARQAAETPGLDNCLGAVIGCNGAVDVNEGVCLSAMKGGDWSERIPLRQRIQSRLPASMPVFLDNWLRYVAHGLIHTAETEARRRFFLVGTHGERVSGALVLDGNLQSGALGLSGEVGHMIVSPGGTRCVCGGQGCLEAEVAPSRVVEKARRLCGQSPGMGSLILANGAEPTFESIVDASNHGDPLARQLMDEAAGHFAVALNNIVQVCDPGLILLFGDYAVSGEFFLKRLRDRLRHTAMVGMERRTRVEPSDLDDTWGMKGAANILTDSLFRRECE